MNMDNIQEATMSWMSNTPSVAETTGHVSHVDEDFATNGV